MCLSDLVGVRREQNGLSENSLYGKVQFMGLCLIVFYFTMVLLLLLLLFLLLSCIDVIITVVVVVVVVVATARRDVDYDGKLIVVEVVDAERNLLNIAGGICSSAQAVPRGKTSVRLNGPISVQIRRVADKCNALNVFWICCGRL